MNYRLSHHAQTELQRRNIPLELVESVINSPQQIVAEREGRKAYQSQVKFDGRTFLLRVIVADDVSPMIIITVYRTSRISKYWSQL